MKSRRLLRISFGILLVTALPAAAANPPAKAKAASGNGITLPISTAWFYMADEKRGYDQIPPYWSQIDFRYVNILMVGPAGVQANGTFGLYNSAQTGNLANRFKWVIHTARSQNPSIKIIVSQWWGNGDGIWGRALSALKTDADIQKYTSSVHDFLNMYLQTAGGVDGYDIDYESNNVSSHTEAITRQIRAQLARLSEANRGRPFYLTVSPDSTSYLKEAVGSLDFVNMQTYAGGWDLTPKSFLDLGLKSTQLLYGICPETACRTRSLSEVKRAYTDNKLVGIHLWRLNSDNYQQEGQVQRQVYNFLHGIPAAPAPPKTSPPGH
jgi:glycosyl hydrolase family 18 (putative chitinase)